MKINWKKIAFIVCGFLLSASICFACFDDDPDSGLWDVPVVIEGEDGSTTDIDYVGNVTVFEDPSSDPDPDPLPFPFPFPFPDVEETGNSYATIIQASFPITLQLSFSGFLSSSGTQVSEPITRMCILYFSRDKRWIIYKEIRNPQFEVISSNAEELRALFGKHTIPHSLGYSEGEALPILIYFESENHSSFNLNMVLGSKNPKPIDKQVIAIVVKNNKIPR